MIMLGLILGQSNATDRTLRLNALDEQLLEACRSGDYKQVEKALSNGANPHAVHTHGWPALMLTAWRGHTDIALRLLRAGVDVNAVNTCGDTALMIAAWRGQREITKLLLDHGAKKDIANQYNYTAAMWAAEKRNVYILELLEEPC